MEFYSKMTGAKLKVGSFLRMMINCSESSKDRSKYFFKKFFITKIVLTIPLV